MAEQHVRARELAEIEEEGDGLRCGERVCRTLLPGSGAGGLRGGGTAARRAGVREREQGERRRDGVGVEGAARCETHDDLVLKIRARRRCAPLAGGGGRRRGSSLRGRGGGCGGGPSPGPPSPPPPACRPH